MEKKTFTVEGMKCEMCKAKVEEALCAIEGVESAEVSLNDKSVEVVFDDATVSCDDLKDAVEDAGRFEMIL
jgi:copper ion binding protein